MSIAIYRTPIDPTEWAPTRAEYTFAAVADAEPYAWIDPPPGWMLIGDPPLLVKRLDHATIKSMSATDALYFSLARVDGFAVAGLVGDGNAAILGVEMAGRSSSSGSQTELPSPRPIGKKGRGLPSPAERNGSQ